MKALLKLALAVVLLGALGLGIRSWYFGSSGTAGAVYRTAPVERGELVAVISATGTVEPEEVVDVGAQVAGKIDAFGADTEGHTVDYGSTVEEGTVLALIDSSLYAADVAAAEGQVAQADAGLLRAQADLVEAKARLEQAARDWDRAQRLGPSDALAQSSYDAYKAGHEMAGASVAVAEAAIQQAAAAQAQARASLQRAQRNLGYCTIRSPVKGVIIDRRVNIGQTVVASLNAPSLFLIAKDLTRMQVWVAVNEADIGSIRAGQPVTFTVDAFPGDVFAGEVGKVRLNATMTQNVVNYTVEVHTDNSDGKLLPYLTANVQFEVSRRADALSVPNAALRFEPPPALVAPATVAHTTPARGAPPSPDPERVPENGHAPRHGRVWVLEGKLVRPVELELGLSDGTRTEVLGDALREGAEVVVALELPDEAAGTGTSTNPFAPQMFPSRRPPQ